MSILDDIDNKLLEDIMTIYSEISGHNMVLFKKGENIPIGPSEKINPFCKTIDEAGLTSLCMDDYLKRKQKVKGSASNTTCHAGLNNFIMSLDYKKDTLGHLVTGQTILAGSGEKPQKQFQKFIKRMINEQIVPEEVIETFKKEYGELDTSFDPMEYHNLLTNAKSVYDNLFKWMDIRNEKATVRDAFIVATAHHILTFIHSLLNSGKTLQTSLKSSEYNWVQDELLEETYRISLDLLKFIDFIQIEEVSPLDNMADINLLNMYNKIKNAYRTEINHKALIIHPQVSNVSVTGPTIHIELALTNLIHNAIKYSFPGQSIEINIGKFDYENDDDIEIEITNYGVGITQQEIYTNWVFDAGYIGKNAKMKQLAGSGLGLYIIKYVANLVGGVVNIDSVPMKEPGYWHNGYHYGVPWKTTVRMYLPNICKGTRKLNDDRDEVFHLNNSILKFFTKEYELPTFMFYNGIYERNIPSGWKCDELLIENASCGHQCKSPDSLEIYKEGGKKIFTCPGNHSYYCYPAKTWDNSIAFVGVGPIHSDEEIDNVSEPTVGPAILDEETLSHINKISKLLTTLDSRDLLEKEKKANEKGIAIHSFDQYLCAIRDHYVVMKNTNPNRKEKNEFIDGICGYINRFYAHAENVRSVYLQTQPYVMNKIRDRSFWDIFNTCINSVKQHANYQKKEFNIILPSGKIEIYGTRLGLRRAILNLLENAISYTPYGSKIKIEIKTSSSFIEIILTNKYRAVTKRSPLEPWNYTLSNNEKSLDDKGVRGKTAPQWVLTGLGMGLTEAKRYALEIGGDCRINIDIENNIFEVKLSLPRYYEEVKK